MAYVTEGTERLPSALGVNGRFVYHYTSRAAAFEHILPAKSFRLGSLSSMRDPLDNKERAQNVFTPVSWPDADVDRLLQLEQDTLTNTKILSLTIDKPLEPGVSETHAWGYARPRMWEQYGENHRGVCLVFDRAALHAAIMPRLEAINLTTWGEVIYSDFPLDGFPNARKLDATTLMVSGGEDVARGYRAHLQENAPELFFRKVEDWATERELRYVLLDDDGSEVIVPYGKLHAVIVGERFPLWQHPGAAKLCHEAGAQILTIEWGGTPALVKHGE